MKIKQPLRPPQHYHYASAPPTPPPTGSKVTHPTHGTLHPCTTQLSTPSWMAAYKPGWGTGGAVHLGPGPSAQRREPQTPPDQKNNKGSHEPPRRGWGPGGATPSGQSSAPHRRRPWLMSGWPATAHCGDCKGLARGGDGGVWRGGGGHRLLPTKPPPKGEKIAFNNIMRCYPGSSSTAN